MYETDTDVSNKISFLTFIKCGKIGLILFLHKTVQIYNNHELYFANAANRIKGLK